MNFVAVLLILIAHYVGDWVAQPFFQRWMGQKHRRFGHLLTHVLVYTAALQFGTMWLATDATMLPIIVWAWGNGVLHGVVDFFSSRLTHRFHADDNQPMFWFTIGTDQTVHLVTLFVTWGLV